jgi:hypothetical protein
MAQTPKDWQELTRLTQGAALVVERVRLADSGIAIEGQFALPQLAQLPFVRSHGSIKEMEQVFGVSYPTIKARLNRIAERLEFVDTDPAPAKGDVIDRLVRGEISAEDAIRELEASK